MTRRFVLFFILVLIGIVALCYSISDLLPTRRDKFKTIQNQELTVSAYVVVGNATVGDEVQIVQELDSRDTVLEDIQNYNFIVDVFFKNQDTITVIVRDTSIAGSDQTFYVKIGSN